MANGNDDARVGKTFGGYRFEEWLGGGTFGDVYKVCLDRQPEREYAIKVFRYTSAMIGKRTMREVEAQSRNLNHPYVVKVHAALKIEENPAALMWRHPCSLHDYIHTPAPTGGLAPTEALRIFFQVLRAMDYAHERGYVHRDIKPCNILLCERSRAGQYHALVTDFGTAKLIDAEPLTLPDQSLGTRHYMSPEQHDAASVGPESDVFSLGCVFYEMLVGRMAFNRKVESPEDARALEAQINRGDYDRKRLFDLGIPISWIDAIDWALEPDRKRRIQSCRAFEGLLGGMRAPSSWVFDDLDMRGASKLEYVYVCDSAGPPFVGVPRDAMSDPVQRVGIGRHPVTNEQFRAFLEGEGVEPAAVGLRRLPPADRRPVVGVSYEGAKRFCSWAKGTLPSEELWAYAATRGEAGRYPWGHQPGPSPSRTAFGGGEEGAAVVGGRPLGRSWCGAEDMVGNVWEWLLAPEEGASTALQAGGAWDSHVNELHVELRRSKRLMQVDEKAGFRVARMWRN